jgi:hypothetical protein
MAAATPVGAQLVQEGDNASSLRYDTLGKDSEVFAVGDVITIASGVLKVAGATDTVIGVSAKAQTMAATNDTVYQPFIPVAMNSIFLMGCNADLTDNETDGGTYYKITGLTGAQYVDVTSGVQATTARIVEIVKVDPFNEGTTGVGGGSRKAYVRFVKTPYFNVSTTT